MNSFALYIHIPFCVRKCPYCSFCSVNLEDDSYPDRVIEGITREASGRADHSPWNKLPVHSVYLGGGTPSILNREQIEYLAQRLNAIFKIDPDAERSIEINPGTFNEDKMDAWLSSGINRVSLGAQSLDDGILKQLGRIHNQKEVLEGYQKLREKGFENISVDLIYGINIQEKSKRNQVIQVWKNTLDGVIDLNPEHISLYALTIEEGTVFNELSNSGHQLKLDVEPEVEQYETAFRLLAENSYQQYEVSNWAKPGYECRHNISYWDGSPYLGLGPSAHSFNPFSNTRSWNFSAIEDWLSSVGSSGVGMQASEQLTPVQVFEEKLMLGLRMSKGVSLLELEKLAESAGIKWPLDKLDLMIGEGYLEKKEAVLRYTSRGILLANEIEPYLLS